MVHMDHHFLVEAGKWLLKNAAGNADYFFSKAQFRGRGSHIRKCNWEGVRKEEGWGMAIQEGWGNIPKAQVFLADLTINSWDQPFTVYKSIQHHWHQ